MTVASLYYTCFCLVLCLLGHFVMVYLNLTCLRCLQHPFFEHFFNLYWHNRIKVNKRLPNIADPTAMVPGRLYQPSLGLYRCVAGETCRTTVKMGNQYFHHFTSASTCHCGPGLYRCRDGETCLSPAKVCDGAPDCPSGEDENNCCM